MDMPVILNDYLPGIKIESIQETMADYQPAWEILQHTWGHETLQELMQGKVTVPDSLINDAIKERLAKEKAEYQKKYEDRVREIEDAYDEAEEAAEAAGENSPSDIKKRKKQKEKDLKALKEEEQPVSELKLTSKENGRLEIYAKTAKLGRLEFSGTIEKFVHNEEGSYVTYRIRERALKDHGLASWFFSRISLSMGERLFGKLDLGENLPTTIKGNYITVDCKEILEHSELATAEIKGHRVLDMLEIKNAVPHDGYIQLETSLNIPQDIQTAVIDIILRRS